MVFIESIIPRVPERKTPKEETVKIKHIDHIGIAVKTIEQAGKFYTDVLGLKIMDIENVADQKVNVAFLPITDSEVELIESTHEDGPVVSTF